MPKPKPVKNSEHRTGTKASRARGKHGRTFCHRCATKIAYGMQFCNDVCRNAYRNAERPPTKAEPAVPVTDAPRVAVLTTEQLVNTIAAMLSLADDAD